MEAMATRTDRPLGGWRDVDLVTFAQARGAERRTLGMDQAIPAPEVKSKAPAGRSRRFIRLVTLLAVVISVFAALALPATALAQTSGTMGTGCTWTLDDAGTLTIAPTDGVSGTMARLGLVEGLDTSAIKSIVVRDGVQAPENSFCLFYDLEALESADVSALDTSNVTDLISTFEGCSSLESLDISGWDTSHVRLMATTFRGCSSLKALNVSGWDTSNVEQMLSVFEDCSSLESLDLSSWDTSHVVGLSDTFKGCSSLKSLDVSGWDTSNVELMEAVFYGCSSLESLDLSSWDTSKAEADAMFAMFSGCSGLTEVRVGEKYVMHEGTFPDGQWRSAMTGEAYNAATIIAKRSGVADTYTRAFVADTAPMYRLYNPWSGEHLFTTDASEYASLAAIGWNQEGVAWQAPKVSQNRVYRLYNRWSGDHFYTGDEDEYERLGSIGWNQEGVAFYSDDAQGVPIYRLFNQWLTAGTHLFTTDYDEYQDLCGLGWSGEDVAFYGVATQSGAVNFSVVTQDGEPISGVYMTFSNGEVGDGEVMFDMLTDENGTCTVPAVMAGSYEHEYINYPTYSFVDDDVWTVDGTAVMNAQDDRIESLYINGQKVESEIDVFIADFTFPVEAGKVMDVKVVFNIEKK